MKFLRCRNASKMMQRILKKPLNDLILIFFIIFYLIDKYLMQTKFFKQLLKLCLFIRPAP